MRYLIGILAVLGLSASIFAQTFCEQSCCNDAGGTWDSGYEMCDNADYSYYTCLSEDCSQETGGSYSPGPSASCCGSAFVMAAVGGGALFLSKK